MFRSKSPSPVSIGIHLFVYFHRQSPHATTHFKPCLRQGQDGLHGFLEDFSHLHFTNCISNSDGGS